MRISCKNRQFFRRFYPFFRARYPAGPPIGLSVIVPAAEAVYCHSRLRASFGRCSRAIPGFNRHYIRFCCRALPLPSRVRNYTNCILKSTMVNADIKSKHFGFFSIPKAHLDFNQYYKPGDYFPAKILPLPRH